MSISSPKDRTGIKASLVQPYVLHDIAWNNPQDVNFLKFSYLTQYFVQVDAVWYVLDKHTERWTKYPTMASAIRTVFQQRGGQVAIGGTHQVITHDCVKNFAKYGLLQFAATIYAPGCKDFVLYKGDKRLNIYKDHRIAGDTDNIADTEEMLKVIRNSLCAAPDEKGLDAMLAEISGPAPTSFKWVMHWLAARYQMPGFAPQTNLWFIGELRGVGKGTLIQLMRVVLGGSTVGKASQEDVAKGWTDCFLNKELVEWDEFKAADGWRKFSNLLKEKTGNDELTVNQRNVGVTVHPNVAMHIFSTNEERPIMVEDFDRQNTFINTTIDHAWKARAKGLFDQTTREFVEPNLPSGFAALLNTIDVDVAFITAPLMTEKREELRASSEDSVKTFVSEGGTDYLKDEEKIEWTTFHDSYRYWVNDHTNMKSDDLKEFKRKIEKYGYGTSFVSSIKLPDGRWKSARMCKLSLPVAVISVIAGGGGC